MKALEVKVDDKGTLKLPPGVSLPSRARLAVLVFESSDGVDLSGTTISELAEKSGTFDFLKEEPEIYSDSDILPGRKNPRFGKQPGMFQPGEIVHAAFPFTDLTTSKRRPCLVLARCDTPDDFIVALSRQRHLPRSRRMLLPLSRATRNGRRRV